MKTEELSRELKRRLGAMYGAGEAGAMTSLIFHHLKGWDSTQLIINGDLPVSDRMLRHVGEILLRLENHEPIQYILGEARFYGMDLTVRPGVLIPRPETAELVDMIVDDFRDSCDMRILDIGTGSGAIAIALARNIPFAKVTAIDISPVALDIARENARRLHAVVDFIKADIFSYDPSPESLDIIVSNPPYIPEEEKKGMEANVLDHEPAEALFVPDSDPLVYYRRIGETGAEALVPGGRLYLEINPRFAGDICHMLEAQGYGDAEAHRDSFGRQRFVTARRHG